MQAGQPKDTEKEQHIELPLSVTDCDFKWLKFLGVPLTSEHDGISI